MIDVGYDGVVVISSFILIPEALGLRMEGEFTQCEPLSDVMISGCYCFNYFLLFTFLILEEGNF